MQTRGGFVATAVEATGRITRICAIVSGALFLPLAFFMTIDATSRRLGGPFSGISDEIASYVLAFGGTWALASALRFGAHVRIDVAMHLYPARVRHYLNLWALLMVALFAGILASEAWQLAYASHAMGARSFSLLGAPLALPQGLTAVGFSLLALQAAASLAGSLLGQEPKTSPGADAI